MGTLYNITHGAFLVWFCSPVPQMAVSKNFVTIGPPQLVKEQTPVWVVSVCKKYLIFYWPHFLQ